MTAGGEAFVSKPVDRQTFLEIVAKYGQAKGARAAEAALGVDGGSTSDERFELGLAQDKDA